MIKKTKHPSNKAERRAIEIRKKLHKGASPVAKLLNDKEIKDALAKDRTNTGVEPPQQYP